MKPTVSVVMPIFNKEFLIERVLRSILENKSQFVKELIFVFDGCTDRTEELSMKILDDVKDVNVIVEHTPNVFETKADNVALKLSTCDYSMIVQDDMVIEEKDFDARMVKPFIFEDTFSVTSRLAHNDYYLNGNMGWGDYAGFDPYKKNFGSSPRNLFSIRDICNRGPLLVDNEKMRALNYFDEAFSPQQYDDHDICFRAWEQHGWVSGSFWIKWCSKEEWGGSRQEVYTDTTEHNRDKYYWLEACGQKNKSLIIERHYDLLFPDKKHNEERILLN